MKMMIVAGLLASSAAMAQDACFIVPAGKMPSDIAGSNGIIYYPMVIQSYVTPVTIFEMQDSSCIRGPIVIRQFDGTEAFRLKAGEWFPADCKDHPDAWKTK